MTSLVIFVIWVFEGGQIAKRIRRADWVMPSRLRLLASVMSAASLQLDAAHANDIPMRLHRAIIAWDVTAHRLTLPSCSSPGVGREMTQRNPLRDRGRETRRLASSASASIRVNLGRISSSGRWSGLISVTVRPANLGLVTRVESVVDASASVSPNGSGTSANGASTKFSTSTSE
jgi:hypothetical protein